ncbi:MAG: PEGA domain-containing protein [Betaproteobacteria bacterium]
MQQVQPYRSAPRVEPQGQPYRSAPRVERQVQPYRTAPRVEPRVDPYRAAPRALPQAQPYRSAPHVEPRVQPYRGGPGIGGARPSPRAVPRGNIYGTPYRNDSRYRSRDDDRGRDWRGRVYSPRYGYSPYAYRPYSYGYHPYYTFRPRLRIGFGIYIGYPVAYPYAIYPSPVHVYGYYPPAGTVTVAPSYSSYGGISLEIGPPDADVYVDGEYVGRADDFGPNQPPLTMSPGQHRIELAAPGYETLAFDVDVIPGQVVPYQGTLRAY